MINNKNQSANDSSSHQSSGSFLGFLHFTVRPLAEGFQELVPVLQVVLVVVPLHGLPLHGHLLHRGFAQRWIRRQSADTQALHSVAFAKVTANTVIPPSATD